MSQNLRIEHYPGPDQLATAAAVELLGLLKRRTDLSIPFGVALSGGRIARPFYQSIVSGAKRSPTSFSEVHFFWADERCVPPNDPENSYAIAREHLFEPLAIPAANIHRIRGEVSPSFALQEAEAELCRLMPLTPAGQPILNLVILGMGEDGHVASLFPNEGPELVQDGRVYRKVTASKPPPDRITLGYQPILAAQEVWILASGSGKASAYRALLTANEDLPVTRVVKGRTSTVIFQDIERSGE